MSGLHKELRLIKIFRLHNLLRLTGVASRGVLRLPPVRRARGRCVRTPCSLRIGILRLHRPALLPRVAVMVVRGRIQRRRAR